MFATQLCVHFTGLVTDLKGHFATQVAMGKAHTCVLMKNGEVWTFGVNNKGQCGRDTGSMSQGGKGQWLFEFYCSQGFLCCGTPVSRSIWPMLPFVPANIWVLLHSFSIQHFRFSCLIEAVIMCHWGCYCIFQTAVSFPFCCSRTKSWFHAFHHQQPGCIALHAEHLQTPSSCFQNSVFRGSFVMVLGSD